MYMEPERNRSVMTFGGRVMPVSRDERGCVTGVSIHSQEDKQYWVKDSGLGQELTGLVGTMVEVTGVVDERSMPFPTITVNDYFLMGSY